MAIFKGLIIIGLVSCGFLAVYASADSSSAASGAYYPNAGLPTLFHPMSQ